MPEISDLSLFFAAYQSFLSDNARLGFGFIKWGVHVIADHSVNGRLGVLQLTWGAEQFVGVVSGSAFCCARARAAWI